MRIALAQIKSIKGQVDENIKIHQKWIQAAITEKVDFIIFPELSLTGYEPELAKVLAMHKDDERLDAFQKMADLNQITIGLGAPRFVESGIQIGIFVFQPNQKRRIYSKQHLHPDEIIYFTNGKEHLVVRVKDKNIALAICYESSLEVHLKKAINLQADCYVASVAKSQEGIEKVLNYYSEMAKKYSIPICMVNGIGDSDNFYSAGQSCIVESTGMQLAHLKKDDLGLLVFDTDSLVVKRLLKK